MDQHARENIAAAAAVHQELGRDYDRAVAEGLIERIGEEIDKRIDARLAEPSTRARPAPRRRASEPPAAGRSAWPAVILGLGSMTIGAGLSAGIIAASSTIGPDGVSHQFGPSQAWLIIVLWIIIAVVNVAFSRRP
jgi:anti-sigma factor RsiW